jgi:hypothetical protein
MPFYVDLNDLTNGHAGTIVDPWSWFDLSNEYIVPGTIVYLKGEIDTDIDSPFMQEYVIFDSWGNDPWRIRVQAHFMLTISTLLRNGILSAQGSPFFMGFNFSYVVSPSDNISNNTIFISENDTMGFSVNVINGGNYAIKFYGSTFIGQTAFKTGSFSTGGSPVSPSFTDCIFSVSSAEITDIACLASHCAFSCVDPGGLLSSTDCQFNWTAPTWPAWNADKALWAEALLAAGISSGTGNPEPGTPPYTGYETDPWGNARDGIGALYMPPVIPPTPISPRLKFYGAGTRSVVNGAIFDSPYL